MSHQIITNQMHARKACEMLDFLIEGYLSANCKNVLDKPEHLKYILDCLRDQIDFWAPCLVPMTRPDDWPMNSTIIAPALIEEPRA